ncbi:hypothetical protein Tco_0909251 [Tanacetum coccineum]|uniref:Uncharacterized protein n=1 Tax=Tanacetum coccineum TaxID=301880 RepID=A0ABQ5CPF7_9ASTR
MTTLADKAILFRADNRPPMLEKNMYDSCKSRMEPYMLNRQNGRMILESVESGRLIWPLIMENRVTNAKKYQEQVETISKNKERSICYNCKGEATCPNRWQQTKRSELMLTDLFKRIKFVVQAQQVVQIFLHEEIELAFLANLGIPRGQATQTVITHNVAYQADDLYAYDFDCDELNTAKVAIMANLSH